MVPAADENVAVGPRSRHLGMTAQAQIRIRRGEHFGVDRAVRIVAARTAFAQGRVFVNERAGLFAMTLGARFIQARHGQPAGRLGQVLAVRVMALHTIHFAFQHRMMLGEMKFRLDVQVTLQTRLRIVAGVEDESFHSAAAAQSNVFAARPVAGFTAALARHPALVQLQARVRAGGKLARDLVVAIGASFVAHIGRPFNS